MGRPRKVTKEATNFDLDNEFDNEEEAVAKPDMQGVSIPTGDFRDTDPDAMLERDPDVVHEVGCERGDECECADY